MHPENPDRRKLLKGALNTGVVTLGAMSFPHWMMPALAQGEVDVPFTDVPDTFNPQPVRPGATHFLDTRRINSFYTDNDDFYLVQHYGQPEVDNASYQLNVTGLVDRPLSFSLEQLRSRPVIEKDVGFECGGNGNRLFHGLIGNATWRGVSLRDILTEAGIQPEGKEVVFFGADIGTVPCWRDAAGGQCDCAGHAEDAADIGSGKSVCRGEHLCGTDGSTTGGPAVRGDHDAFRTDGHHGRRICHNRRQRDGDLRQFRD